MPLLGLLLLYCSLFIILVLKLVLEPKIFISSLLYFLSKLKGFSLSFIESYVASILSKVVSTLLFISKVNKYLIVLSLINSNVCSFLLISSK